MSTRTLVRLASAAGLLIALWIGVSVLRSTSAPPASESATALRELLDGVSRETTERVAVVAPDGDSLVLTPRDGAWEVDGFPADSVAVAGFWSEIEGAEVGTLAAANPDNHARMGVAADSSYRLVLDLPEGRRTLLVGRAGSRFGTVYVREPGVDAVHLLEAGLDRHVERDAESWRSRRVVALDTARVRRIEGSRGGTAWVVQRADSIWTRPDGGPVEPSEVRTLLGELADLRADGFLSEGDSLASLPEALRLTALGEAGDTLADLRVGEGEQQRWIRASGRDVLFSIPAWKADRLMPDVEGGEP